MVEQALRRKESEERYSIKIQHTDVKKINTYLEIDIEEEKTEIPLEINKIYRHCTMT